MDLIREFDARIDALHRADLWEGRHVSIVPRDGLAQMKTLAGRDQDLTDLKQLGIRVDR